VFDPAANLPRDDLVLGGPGGEVMHLEVQGRALFSDGRPCMLWPLPPPMPPSASRRVDRVLICYDRSYLTDVFFGQLVEKYVNVEDRRDFLFQLEPRGATESRTRMRADQFPFRTDH